MPAVSTTATVLGWGTIGYQFSRLPQFWHRYGGEYTIFGETGQILVSQIKCSLDQDTIPHHIQQIYCVFHSINIKVVAAPSLYSRAGNSAESVVTINNPRCLHSVFYLAPALPAPFCAARPGVIGGSKKTTNKNMNIFIFGGLWSKTRGGQILVNMAMAMSSQASPQSSPTFNRCCIFVQSSPILQVSTRNIFEGMFYFWYYIFRRSEWLFV